MLNPDSLLVINVTHFPWPSGSGFWDTVSGITGDVGKSQAVALRMIDFFFFFFFAKRLACEVATLTGGYRSRWGRHQLLTARDKLSLPRGVHKSTTVRDGAEVWRKMLGAVMTLRYQSLVF